MLQKQGPSRKAFNVPFQVRQEEEKRKNCQISQIRNT